MVVESRCVRAAGALVELAWLARQVGRQAAGGVAADGRGQPRHCRAGWPTRCAALRCSALLAKRCLRAGPPTRAPPTLPPCGAHHTQCPPGATLACSPQAGGPSAAAALQLPASHAPHTGWLAVVPLHAWVRVCVPACLQHTARHGASRLGQAACGCLCPAAPRHARHRSSACRACLWPLAGAAGLPPVCARRRSSKRNAPAGAAPRAPVGSGCRAHAAAARCVLRAAPLVCVPAAASHTAPPACPATTPPPTPHGHAQHEPSQSNAAPSSQHRPSPAMLTHARPRRASHARLAARCVPLSASRPQQRPAQWSCACLLPLPSCPHLPPLPPPSTAISLPHYRRLRSCGAARRFAGFATSSARRLLAARSSLLAVHCSPFIARCS